MRKLVIGSISFLVVVVGFWLYVTLVDSPSLQLPPVDEVMDMEVPIAIVGPQQTGDTTLEGVEKARYFKYDPVTKQIIAEYGFEQLLNPGQETSRWQVEKPYMIFYKPGYRCRVESEQGTIQMESAGSQHIPKDAQLDKNVVIHIMPRAGSRIDETTIRMDDLTFSSERSEFATDGPVTITSQRLQLEGYGLMLIFNAGEGKIEYLQIKDLVFLRLRNFASSASPSKSQTSGASPSEAVTPQAEPKDKQMVKAEASVPAIKSDDAVVSGKHAPEPPQTDIDSSDLYQCLIFDNVVIEYGDELIVSGAEQVNIQNIDMLEFNKDDQSDSSDQNASEAETRIPVVTADSSKNTTTSAVAVTEQTASEGNPKPEIAQSGDILVRCDGGMVIQPMALSPQKEEGVSDSSLAFEMSGDPLTIDRMPVDGNGKAENLAHCGLLSYKPAEDVLRLFTNAHQPQILLNTQESNSRIETAGNVFWDRKAQRANIAGPGKVYIGNTKNPAGQPSEISFAGVMDLLFAKLPNDVSSATIQTINLTGGMDAILRQNGTLKTLADSAVLTFGLENQISEAQLDGDVYFESFEEGKSSSRAASESATFYFDNNQIAMADLKGGVHFASENGQMDSSNATIEFEADEAGSMHPKVIRTSEQAVLQTVSAMPGQPPAKFEAKRIDYDLQSGSGLAHGPIRFTFYQQAGPNGNTVEPWLPITITADGNAEFLAGADRKINQVVFKENVTAARVTETPLYTQRDEFHGDRLTVDIAKNPAGSVDISKITFAEGRVSGQSTKMRGGEKLFHVRMWCEEMSFSRSDNLIVAAGPGKIEMDNSKAEPAGSGNTGVNFQRPCYALIEGFDTIRWDFDAQQILADGDKDTMQLAYVPLVEGQVEKYIYASSIQFLASFLTDSIGRTALGRVYTDKGITYTEKAGNNTDIIHEMIGQTLEYDAMSDVGWLTITGSETMPVMLDKARVPAIRYNVNTGQIQTSLSRSPGILGGR